MKIIEWSEQGLMPGPLYFQNGNEHTGSVDDFGNKATKEFRYKIEPNEGTIKATVWYGPFCFERSEIIDQSEFTMDEVGRKDMLGWMKEKYESMIE